MVKIESFNAILSTQKYWGLHPLVWFYIVDAFIVLYITGLVVNSTANIAHDKYCGAWDNAAFELNVEGEVVMPADDDDRSRDLANSTSYYMCSSLTTDIEDAFTQVSGSAFWGALIILTCYLVNKAVSVYAFWKLLPHTLSNEAIKNGGVQTIKTMAVCKAIATILAEVVGVTLIFTSTSNQEVIINAAASMFLAEVDEVAVEVIFRAYLINLPGEHEIEVMMVELIVPVSMDEGNAKKVYPQVMVETEEKVH